ncbi:MAG: sigma-70 family RNA polymerase sigma factor, partial [Planctomycetota bacterium]
FPISEQSTANRPCETLGDAWIQSHYEQLFRSAWLMTGDAEEAADMVQETLIVALQRKNRFDQQCQLSTWVHGIMMRVARNRRRMLHRLQQRLRRYARMLRDTRTPDDTAADGCSEMQHREWQQSIWARVANLPVAQCSVVTMRFGQQMSLQEIAVALDCPLGTVKSRLHNALKTLRADVEWNSQIPSSNPSSLAASQLPGEFENDH